MGICGVRRGYCPGLYRLRLYLRGCAQGRATQAAHFLGFPPKTLKITTSGPNPGSRPDEVIFGCFGGVYTKRDHIWPKPMVLGPEPWVWARCGNF